MTTLLSSGAIFGFVFILMIIEACVLIPYYLKTGSGVPPLKLLCALLAGGGLVLACGAILLHAPIACIGASLLLALLGHLADLRYTWRTATTNATTTSKQKVNANALAQSNGM